MRIGFQLVDTNLFMVRGDHTAKIMLLMGMNNSLMIYPMNPITKKPIAQACKIFMYSIFKDMYTDSGRSSEMNKVTHS